MLFRSLTLGLSGDPAFRLAPVHAQQILMQRDRDSSLRLGGGETHYMKIDENASTPGVAGPFVPTPMSSRQREIELIALGDELRFAQGERAAGIRERIAALKMTPASDGVELARKRQTAIDAARARAEHLAEIEELLIAQAEPGTLAHRMMSGAKRRGLGNDPVAGHLERALDDDIWAALGTAAAAWGVKRTEPGHSFDPKLHKPGTGEKLEIGTLVDLKRPGYGFRHEGEEITLFRPEIGRAHV